MEEVESLQGDMKEYNRRIKILNVRKFLEFFEIMIELLICFLKDQGHF